MRLPPNSRVLMDLRRAGRVPVPGPFGHVAILPDWNLETCGAAVLAPPSLDYLDLDFCVVAGLDVTIFVRGADVTNYIDLIAAVMDGAANSITVVDLDRAVDGFGAAILAMYSRIPGDE